MGGECSPEHCGDEKVCMCSYNITAQYGDVLQLVMTNIGSGKGWSHPIHMHGHHFWVLKMGYAEYDPVTAKITGKNENTTVHFIERLVPNGSDTFKNPRSTHQFYYS